MMMTGGREAVAAAIETAIAIAMTNGLNTNRPPPPPLGEMNALVPVRDRDRGPDRGRHRADPANTATAVAAAGAAGVVAIVTIRAVVVAANGLDGQGRVHVPARALGRILLRIRNPPTQGRIGTVSVGSIAVAVGARRTAKSGRKRRYYSHPAEILSATDRQLCLLNTPPPLSKKGGRDLVCIEY